MYHHEKKTTINKNKPGKIHKNYDYERLFNVINIFQRLSGVCGKYRPNEFIAHNEMKIMTDISD